MKLVVTNHHHNIFHWSTVVFIRAIYFFMIAPITIYIMAIGLILFEKTIEPFPPSYLLDKITFYLTKLPFLVFIREFIVQQRYWYKNAPIWLAVNIAIPLILVGASILLINFFNLFFVIFSTHYNHTHCPFCKQPIRLVSK